MKNYIAPAGGGQAGTCQGRRPPRTTSCDGTRLPADDGKKYDEFDDSPRNQARRPRHEREEQEAMEKACRLARELDAMRQPWSDRAEELADWTLRTLTNRTEVWGQYRPMASRGGDGRRKARTMPDKRERGRVLLTRDDLMWHYRGQSVASVLGLHSTSLEGTCRWIAWDIDRHDDSPATPDPSATFRIAQDLVHALEELQLHPLLSDSNGRGGHHVLLILKSPTNAAAAYKFAQSLMKNLNIVCETFPKQPSLGDGQLGNWLRLPGRHHTYDHFTRFWSGERWLEGADAVNLLLGTEGDDPAIIAKAAPQPVTTPKNVPLVAAGDGLVQRVRDILKRLPSARLDDYDDWLRVGRAIYHELPGEEGLALWDEASRQSSKYEAGVCAEKWATFNDAAENPVTVGTLVYWIREYDPDYMPPSQSDIGLDTRPIRIVSWAERIARNPCPTSSPALIEGLLRRGEVMNLISGPKIGKSWLALQIGLSVASGRSWLGMAVMQGPVLILDGELMEPTLEVRISKVADAMGISKAAAQGDVGQNLSLAALRNDEVDIDSLEQSLFADVEPNRYLLIIIDPSYAFLPRKASEIADQDMRHLYSTVRRIAARSNAAVILIHHTSKGRQGDKAITDTGSGHGVISRAPDTHASLLPTDERDPESRGATFRAVTRTFPPPRELKLVKAAAGVPIWRVAGFEEESEEQRRGEGRDLLEARAFATHCARPVAESKTTIVGRHFKFNGIPTSQRRANYLFERALAIGDIIVAPGTDRRKKLYRRPATPAEEHVDNQIESLHQATART